MAQHKFNNVYGTCVDALLAVLSMPWHGQQCCTLLQELRPLFQLPEKTVS